VQDEIQKLADFLAKKKVKVSDKARPASTPRSMHEVYMKLLSAATSGGCRTTNTSSAARRRRPCRPTTRARFAQMLRGMR
jgi:amidase